MCKICVYVLENVRRLFFVYFCVLIINVTLLSESEFFLKKNNGASPARVPATAF